MSSSVLLEQERSEPKDDWCITRYGGTDPTGDWRPGDSL